MAGKLRVGIVGASVNGSWSTRAHIPAIAAQPDIELKAIATTRQESADAAARAFGAELAFGDYREMVARPDIDLIAVVVRVPAHYDLVMQAIEAGKHIYCEWPLGANLGEAEAMTAAAEARGLLNAVGMQGRLDPTQTYMRHLIATGFIGEVVACHMTYYRPGVLARPSDRAWQGDKTKGATTLTILGGHAIDSITYCVGEFAEVSARVATQVKSWHLTDTHDLLDVDAPDNLLVSGRLKNGALAAVHAASLPYYGEGWRLEVWGREGTLVGVSSEGPNIGPLVLMGSQGNEPLVEMTPPAEFSLVPEGTPKGPPYNIGQIYARIVDSLGSGRELEAPAFADALRHHRLLDAIQRSSDEGRAVKLE